MGRYLCQSCYNVVHYDEWHPCLFYPDDDEVYTVPPPNERDEMEGRGEKSMGTNNDNLYENACSSAVRHDSEGPNEANSLLNVNFSRMSLMPPARRKRGRSTPLPSEFVRGKRNRYSASKWASTHNQESRNVAKKSENPRQMVNAPADVLPMEVPSSAESSTSSAASGPDAAAASVAGPSGTRGQTHETGKEKPFPCPKCDKKFTQKCNLKVHLRTHTGELPFPCDVCGRRFSRKDNLTTHLRTHTGERPYRCEFCGRGFARSSHCKSHEKTQHGKK